jgi:predicted 3-demethylubiquinone-9 3-methyltransferase (glyoxalase superfamily)
VKHAIFSLDGQEFMAMDSGLDHQFTFTPAISLLVNCTTLEEIDMLWERFSKEGEIEQCGWLKDRYGVSWQIVPEIINKLLRGQDPDKSRQVTSALLGMKKLDINGLIEAYEH